MCRSFPLGSAGPNLPNLWLELQPTRAFAAQPRVDAYNVTLTLGIQANTRFVPQETKPDCPFPAKLELVPPLDQGKVAIGLPIDVPFTEISALLDSQLKGKTFPDDKNSPAEMTVESATVAAAGDRLLVSLLVSARERKSWLGLGTAATLYISGKPVLDQGQQVVRLESVALAVESDALFGVVGTAVKMATPYLKTALEKNAVIDLKPTLANARRSIDRALMDFRLQNDDIKVDATMTGLRLVGLEFDSRIVRITAEADGIARVALSKLPVK
jgi:predicted small integral membrane protein